MTRLSLKVVNAKLVRSGLQDLDKEIPNIGKQQIYGAMLNAAATLRIYPPKLPKQKYVRTFKLKHGWAVRANPNGYRLTNATSYTKWVVGDAYGNMQATVHVGRWNVQRKVVEDEVAKLPPEIAKHIAMVARRTLPQ